MTSSSLLRTTSLKNAIGPTWTTLLNSSKPSREVTGMDGIVKVLFCTQFTGSSCGKLYIPTKKVPSLLPTRVLHWMRSIHATLLRGEISLSFIVMTCRALFE